jgi:hypothetical protein
VISNASANDIPPDREVPPMTATTTERIHDPVHRVSFRFETEGDRLWVFTRLEPGGHLPEHFHPTLRNTSDDAAHLRTR